MSHSNKFKMITSVISVGFLSMSFANKALADSKYPLCIDVYGTDRFTADDIRNFYKNELTELNELLHSSLPVPDDVNKKRMDKVGKDLEDKIKSKGNFSYLNTEIRTSFATNETCFTVDAIDKKDHQRIPNFLPRQKGNIADPDNILSIWDGYMGIGYKKIFLDYKKIAYESCPVFHCIFGFDDPDFKKYKDIFDSLVPKNKDQIIKILREDKDPKKRINAAQLLAHIKDGNELIEILIPAMRDSDIKVRSTVMEVLYYTLLTMKTADFPVQNAIDVLDYPDEDNRLQAERLIAVIAFQQRYREYIKEHAKGYLITELRMEKADLHDAAYKILQRISNLKFGEHDYNSWESWLNKSNI
jgi:phosphoribosyl-ATP pyrophosphohydrolase